MSFRPFDGDTEITDNGDGSGSIAGTWTGMSSTNVVDLLAGDIYVNIHTADNGGGEIRGNLGN